ncbi:hypothetical protein ANN_10615, partial [Periplaneta americana]
LPRDQNIVRNGNIKIGNLSFEKVEKFKYLAATVTNINGTREEIKRRINVGNACYYSVEKLLSSSLLSKNLKVRIYKTVILPVLLHSCETWTLTLREEHRLRVFENNVLRKIFGAKRDEVTGEWRKLHNTELYALYSSPDIIRNIKSRRLRWAGHVARMGESKNAYRLLVGRPEGKRPLGRPRRRWEYNIKMDLREVGYDDRDWINLAQDRDQWRAYVRAAMNLRVNGITGGGTSWLNTERKIEEQQEGQVGGSNEERRKSGRKGELVEGCKERLVETSKEGRIGGSMEGRAEGRIGESIERRAGSWKHRRKGKLVKDIRKDGLVEGPKEGRIGGRTEGKTYWWKDGLVKGLREERTGGRTEGRTDLWKDIKKNGLVEGPREKRFVRGHKEGRVEEGRVVKRLREERTGGRTEGRTDLWKDIKKDGLKEGPREKRIGERTEEKTYCWKDIKDKLVEGRRKDRLMEGHKDGRIGERSEGSTH